jgi:Carboxypeptidase C (cathepsin A)
MEKNCSDYLIAHCLSTCFVISLSCHFSTVCSTASTQSWIFDIGVSPKSGKLWQPWRLGKQTAGFLTEFDLGSQTNSSFVFATVHGAGHEVPSYRPREALALIKSFLNDEWDVGRRME